MIRLDVSMFADLGATERRKPSPFLSPPFMKSSEIRLRTLGVKNTGRKRECNPIRYRCQANVRRHSRIRYSVKYSEVTEVSGLPSTCGSSLWSTKRWFSLQWKRVAGIRREKEQPQSQRALGPDDYQANPHATSRAFWISGHRCPGRMQRIGPRRVRCASAM